MDHNSKEKAVMKEQREKNDGKVEGQRKGPVHLGDAEPREVDSRFRSSKSRPGLRCRMGEEGLQDGSEKEKERKVTKKQVREEEREEEKKEEDEKKKFTMGKDRQKGCSKEGCKDLYIVCEDISQEVRKIKKDARDGDLNRKGQVDDDEKVGVGTAGGS